MYINHIKNNLSNDDLENFINKKPSLHQIISDIRKRDIQSF